MIKKCRNCRNYDPFYRKGFCDFWREEQGTCLKQGKILQETESCAFWKRLISDKTLPITALDKGMADVIFLERYFKKNKLKTRRLETSVRFCYFLNNQLSSSFQAI